MTNTSTGRGVEGLTPDDDVDDLELIKIDRLAEMWDVSKRTIETLIYEGELPSLKVGWNRRVRRADAVAYLKRQEDLASR